MKKVVWGVISSAKIGRERVLPGMRKSGLIELRALASRDHALARRTADALGIPVTYGSYEELLADPEIDGVYIGLPNALHAPWTIRAAEAGKHVLCEKPLGRHAADVEQMAAACERAGVILMEAFMWRHHPQHARVRELIAAGEIGELTFVRASHAFAMDDARRNLPDVRIQADLDGGAFMDVGCYALNAARYLFDAEPLEVTALQRKDPALGVDTSFAALLRFPGDRLASIDGSFEANGPQRYEVTGFRGSIVLEPAFQPGPLPTSIVLNRGGARHVVEAPGVDQYAREADHFVHSVRAGRLLPPAEDGRAQARVVEALYRSAETGQTVRLA